MHSFWFCSGEREIFLNVHQHVLLSGILLLKKKSPDSFLCELTVFYSWSPSEIASIHNGAGI